MRQRGDIKTKIKYFEFRDVCDNQICDQILDKWQNMKLKIKL